MTCRMFRVPCQPSCNRGAEVWVLTEMSPAEAKAKMASQGKGDMALLSYAVASGREQLDVFETKSTVREILTFLQQAYKNFSANRNSDIPRLSMA